jgi:carboxyl-terminal processing protease
MNLKTFFLLLIILASGEAQAQPDQLSEQKLQTFFRYIEMAYVDSINAPKLVETAIKSILKELDPHSTYIPAEELRRMNEPLEGKFEGIGIQFNILRDTIVVVSPIAGGPSELLGIRSGDRIIKIDTQTVAGVGFTNQDVFERLRGKKGTQVNVSIKRGNTEDLIEFNITRDKIPIYSVDASYMLDKSTGYIKLNRFAATSMEEIRMGLDKLQSNGMQNLVLDLRGNSGGYLQTAIDLVDEFIAKDKLIVYTEGRAYAKDETYSTDKGKFKKGKLVVLIDEGSASASEIVSGAVQDWDRGLIIGRRSFGKGLVQRPFNLPDGSAMRLTVSRYFTPSGRCIQRPYEGGDESYYKDLQERYSHGELVHPDSIKFPDSLIYSTKIRQRKVYGGGGIMPDIFIPLDTTRGSEYYSKLIRKGVLNDFVLDYTQQNKRDLLDKYPEITSFKTGFDVEKECKEKLIAYAKKQEIEFDETQYEKSSSLIHSSLKGLIARSLWEPGAFYEIINLDDPAILKALESINDKTFQKLKLVYN